MSDIYPLNISIFPSDPRSPVTAILYSALTILALSGLGLGLVGLIAYLISSTAVYTITNKHNQMEPIKTYTHGNTKLEIHNDESPESPRTWDNLGKMICHHRRYNLGDEHTINPNHYNSYDEMRKAIIRKEDVAVILPMYMYEHSGISIATTPFNCPWDSGQIGFIIASKKWFQDNK